MIKVAQLNDLPALMTFYNDLIVAMAQTAFPSGWQKGVYPDENYVRTAIVHGELFVNWQDDQIVSAMVLNSVANDGYAQAAWAVADTGDNILLITPWASVRRCKAAELPNKWSILRLLMGEKCTNKQFIWMR